ncbi:MAG TPA: DUF4911 domain-containing protein [Desulfonatronum sp.]|nr:DUF4911 domain-containing protein [Desulfonatronum sp.]
MSESNTGRGPRWSSRIYLRVDPGDIAVMKFFLEACDNLAFLSTISPHTAVARLVFAPDQEIEVRRFLHAVALETPWTEVWSCRGNEP